jgi:hypothetical protein
MLQENYHYSPRSEIFCPRGEKYSNFGFMGRDADWFGRQTDAKLLTERAVSIFTANEKSA